MIAGIEDVGMNRMNGISVGMKHNYEIEAADGMTVDDYTV